MTSSTEVLFRLFSTEKEFVPPDISGKGISPVPSFGAAAQMADQSHDGKLVT